MRNLLALVGLLVVGFVGIGWYMGWYKFSYAQNSDGKLEIKTNVDTQKVGDDSTTFFKNAAKVIGGQIDKTAKDANASAPAGTPGSTPGPVNSSQGSAFNPFAPAAPEQPAPTLPTIPTRQPIRLLPPK